MELWWMIPGLLLGRRSQHQSWEGKSVSLFLWNRRLFIFIDSPDSGGWVNLTVGLPITAFIKNRAIDGFESSPSVGQVRTGVTLGCGPVCFVLVELVSLLRASPWRPSQFCYCPVVPTVLSQSCRRTVTSAVLPIQILPDLNFFLRLTPPVNDYMCSIQKVLPFLLRYKTTFEKCLHNRQTDRSMLDWPACGPDLSPIKCVYNKWDLTQWVEGFFFFLVRGPQFVNTAD